MRSWLNSSCPVPDPGGPCQPKAIPEDAATYAERERCLTYIAIYIASLEAGELRGASKRKLLVELYRKFWGKRRVSAWVRKVNDTETHVERQRCMAVLTEYGCRVGRGELDHVSRRDLLQAVFDRVEGG